MRYTLKDILDSIIVLGLESMQTGKFTDSWSNNMYFQMPNTSGAEWIFRASDGVNRASINLNGSYSSF